MSGWLQNLAECGCDYVERARNRVPLLNHAIQAVEPYVLPVFEVGELYFEAAFSSVSEHGQGCSTRSRCSAEDPRRNESKLFRVSSTVDLLQLRHAPRDRGLVHRARQVATKMLSQLEAFVDNLAAPDTGSKGSGSAVALRSLGRCPSHSSFSSSRSASLDSTEVDDSSSEMCFTTLEMIPRALALPLILQVQIMRVVVDKSSSILCSVATVCGASLLKGALFVARLTLRGGCKMLALVGGHRRIAILKDGLLHRSPLARRAMACVMDDCQAKSAKSAGETEPPETYGERDGGTGCCTL